MGDTDFAVLAEWMEEVPFSKENCLRNVTREFSDGYCVAEIIAHFCPKLINMNVFHPVSATPQKMTQWATLNKKSLAKLDCLIPVDVIKQVVNYKPGAAELVIRNLRLKIDAWLKPPREDLPPGEKQAGPGPTANGKKKKGGAGGAGKKKRATGAPGGGDAESGPSEPNTGSAGLHQELETKDRIIADYEEVIQIFQTKVKKLDQLLKLKDRRIDDLVRKCKEQGIR